MCGKSAYCWKTMFTGRRFAGTFVTSVPWRTMRPASGSSKPATMRRVVVLPHPLGPSSEKNSPSSISSDTSSTAGSAPKSLLTPTRPIAARPCSRIRAESIPVEARIQSQALIGRAHRCKVGRWRRRGLSTQTRARPDDDQAAAPPPPDVRLVGVRKAYGDVAAVDGVDLDVRTGEFFTMLVPSGSGKTTTLRLIAGFERPDEGRIELHGSDVTGRPPYLRDVNTVFQDYALFPHMTVGENVAYGLRVKGARRRERGEKAARAL